MDLGACLAKPQALCCAFGNKVSSEVARFCVECVELIGQRFEPVDNDVNDRHLRFGSFLDVAVNDPRGRAAGNTVVTIPHVLMNDEIHGARFVFERDERDAFGRAGALS
jgi:hypothetical protein